MNGPMIAARLMPIEKTERPASRRAPWLTARMLVRPLLSQNMGSNVVQLADDGGDVGLEQAGAHHDEEQPGKEGRQQRQPDERAGEGEVSQGDDASTDEDRAPLTPQPVGDPAAGQGERVDHGGVAAVDGGRVADSSPRPGLAPVTAAVMKSTSRALMP